MTKKILLEILLVIGLMALLVVAFKLYGDCSACKKSNNVVVTNFAECAEAGNAIMESYPARCRHGETTYTEYIGNELEKMDLIVLETPRPNAVVKSPLTVRGQARGNWYFEASFPIRLYDANGKQLSVGIAQAQGEWMTTEFVPFEVSLTFDTPTTETGTLILEKDNASGLVEHDDHLELPVRFK